MPDLARLTYNDTITYRCGFTTQYDVPDQEELEHGPYQGKVVDLGELVVGVRADGMDGQAPLYFVFRVDIVSVEEQ